MVPFVKLVLNLPFVCLHSNSKEEHQKSIFVHCEKGGYRLKDNVQFHLYISTSPCGDARIFSPHEAGVEGTAASFLLHSSADVFIICSQFCFIKCVLYVIKFVGFSSYSCLVSFNQNFTPMSKYALQTHLNKAPVIRAFCHSLSVSISLPPAQLTRTVCLINLPLTLVKVFSVAHGRLNRKQPHSISHRIDGACWWNGRTH